FDGYYTIFRDGSTTLPAGTVTLNRYFSVQTGQSYVVDPSQSGGSNGLGSETGVITINGVQVSFSDPPEAPIPTSSQPTWSMAALGDFGGEGGAGLAFQRSSDSLVVIQLFQGATRIGGGDLGNSPFDAGWQVAASGDFNGDGRPDLVWRRGADGLTEIQFLNGLTALGGGPIADNPFDKDWQIAASGDFNGDGKSDLVWRHGSDGLTEIQFLNGMTAVGGGILANNPFDSSWNVVGAGDFNRDGNADLVWRRSSDGLTEVQFVNGMTAVGGGVIANNSFDSSWNVVARSEDHTPELQSH